MLSTDINIMSWNATGIMSSASYLSNSLKAKQIDICGISEHWLYEKDLVFLDQIDSNYKSHAVSVFDLKSPGRRRVGKGGVAILWHRKLDKSVTALSFDDDKIIGIKFEINPSSYVYFFQIYLPCINHSFDSFQDYIDRLNNILGLYSDKGLVVIMGDVNANILSAKFRKDLNNRSRYVLKFLNENYLVSVNTLDICTGARSSFVSYDTTCESLIDHILFPIEKVHFVSSCEICMDDALNVSGVPVYLAPWTGCPPGGKPTMDGLPPGGQPVPGYPTPHPGYLHPGGQHIPAGLSCPPGVKLNQPGYLAPHP